MKRLRINSGFIGLIFKNNDYKKVITEGSYWLKPGEKAEVYDMTKPFKPATDLRILLKDPELATHLSVIEVKDNEVVFLFENNNFKNILYPGRYAFWKAWVKYDFIKADTSCCEITEDIPPYLFMRSELSPLIRVYTIDSYEKGILLINGSLVKILECGTYVFWKNQVPVSVLKTDLRQQQMEISGQEILTRDKTNIRINFFVSFKVVDIVKALVNNKDFEKQLYVQIQLALREYIGNYTLDEILEIKESITAQVLQNAKTKSAELGVEVTGCGMRDIILPGDVKEIMNQVLIAEKRAQANIITRREETASTRSLLNTARLMEENTMLFKLKEMEYVEKIAEKINNISISGNSQVLDQLKMLFSAPGK